MATITVYQDGNFQGASKTFNGNEFPYVGNDWNDKISSIKIDAAPEETWMFFEDKEYAGENFQLKSGEYPSLPSGFNDVISSMRKVVQIQGPTITVYRDGNFKGASKTFNGDEENVGDEWNNTISSIKVNDPGKFWNFYEDADYGGKSFQLETGNYPIVPAGFNDEISSMRVAKTTNSPSVTIYVDSEFEGESETYTQDVSWVGEKLNDRISSIVVEGGTWEFYENTNHSGKVIQLRAGDYNYLPNEWNDEISSLKIASKIYSNFEDDIIVANASPGTNTIIANPQIVGLSEAYGDGGSTYINGGSGNDTINSGGGNDTIVGGAGNNLIYAYVGDDIIEASEGDDYIDGGEGTDTINGGNGFDVIATGKIDGNNNILRGDEVGGVRNNDIFMIFAPDNATTSSGPGSLAVSQQMISTVALFAQFLSAAKLASPYAAIVLNATNLIINWVKLFTGKGKEPTPPVWKDMTVIQDFGVEDVLVLGVGDFHSENQNVTYNELGIYGVPATKFYDETKSSERPQVLLENFQLESDAGWAVQKQDAGKDGSDANFFQIYVKEGYENQLDKDKGSAQNSYIEGATVFLDENENGKLDENEPFTTTDEDGYYDHSLLETENKEGTIVSVGGKYILENEPYELVFTAPKEFKHISPLSTLYTAILAEGITQEQLAAHFGIALHSNILDDDHIQSFISSFKTDEENSDLLEEKALVNQEIGHLMAVGAEYLVKEGLATTVAEGGAIIIDALANIIKNAIEQDEPFSLRSEEDLEKVAIEIGIAPSEAPKVVEEYLAKDMELHMANILSTFDPENDEETTVIYGQDEGDEIKLDSSATQPHIVHGNGGDDVIDVSESQAEYTNTVKGDSGADQIIAGHSDKLMGGTGNDTIDGSKGGGSNKLYGQEDADIIIGAEGTNDTIDGGPGNDELYAGSGNILTGNEDQDTFWLAIDKLPEEINTVTDLTPGEDVIGFKGIVINGRSLEFGDLVFTDVEKHTELGINDGEKVQPLATFLYISAEELNNPDNFVIPTPSMERIFGTTEADVIQVPNSLAPQLVFAGDGDDFVDASSANVAVQNVIYGGLGNDIITAGSRDILLGNEGDDAFYITSGGDNILTGGSGADQFWLASAEYPAAMNQITDFEVGIDVLGIGGLGLEFADLTLTQADNNTIVAIGSNGLELASLLGIAPEQLSADNFVFV